MNNPMDDDDTVIIPFVLTKKHGGEYDNEAFTAGWNLALLESRLTMAEAGDLIIPPIYLKAKWKAQADLIAMSHSLVVKTVSTEDPDYLLFIFGTPEFFNDSEE